MCRARKCTCICAMAHLLHQHHEDAWLHTVRNTRNRLRPMLDDEQRKEHDEAPHKLLRL